MRNVQLYNISVFIYLTARFVLRPLTCLCKYWWNSKSSIFHRQLIKNLIIFIKVVQMICMKIVEKIDNHFGKRIGFFWRNLLLDAIEFRNDQRISPRIIKNNHSDYFRIIYSHIVQFGCASRSFFNRKLQFQLDNRKFRLKVWSFKQLHILGNK